MQLIHKHELFKSIFYYFNRNQCMLVKLYKSNQFNKHDRYHLIKIQFLLKVCIILYGFILRTTNYL